MISPDQYQALRERAGIVDRTARGRLRLTGEDRRSYLQGLLTNDIAALTPGTGCYAALLTAQGRMLADMRVLELGDAILMDVDRSIATMVRDHLDRFIFSEDVQVIDETASLAQIGVYGPAAAAALRTGLSTEDPSVSPDALEAMAIFSSRLVQFAGGGAILVRSDEIGLAGFDIFVDAARADALRDALRRAGTIDVGGDVAEVVRIEAGRPAFGKDMTTDTIPLEAGIEDRAISMTKGCYVGQEIIVRVLHRGHGRVARRLVGLTLDASAPVPAEGATIGSGDREIGVVTSATSSPALGRPIALGYLHRDFVEPGTVVQIGQTSAVVSATPFVGQPA